MRKIYLVRHAKSSWDDNKLKDIERPLNKRGEKDAPFMGKLMKEKEIKPDLIISSPAERALETAKIFCNEMKVDENQISVEQGLYNAGKKELLNVINSFDDKVPTIPVYLI